MRFPYFGDKSYCCICESEVDGFLPWVGYKENQFTDNFKMIGSDDMNFHCPNCYCHDRERHLWLYINELEIYDKLEKRNILVIAPDKNLTKKLFMKTGNIYLGDLNPEVYCNIGFNVIKTDLTNLQIQDSIFDLVIANHVLEHIPDYQKAISEIFRVLKLGGIAILQTPYSNFFYNNFEDPAINTNELRTIYYGQEDHVRIFGKKLFDDLSANGFDVYKINHHTALKDYNSKTYGVNVNEDLILVKKTINNQINTDN